VQTNERTNNKRSFLNRTRKCVLCVCVWRQRKIDCSQNTTYCSGEKNKNALLLSSALWYFSSQVFTKRGPLHFFFCPPLLSCCAKAALALLTTWAHDDAKQRRQRRV
jgi:hypothetical protein